jgi:hypothetical protein
VMAEKPGLCAGIGRREKNGSEDPPLQRREAEKPKAKRDFSPSCGWVRNDVQEKTKALIGYFAALQGNARAKATEAL